MNPVHLHGRKWRNVIVTLPNIEEPPVRPARKKKRKIKPNPTSVEIVYSSATQIVSAKPFDTRLASYTNALNAFSSLQLRRYLCVAKTAIFVTRERNSSRTYRRDLYSIFSQYAANESPTTMSRANAVSPILRNASLTNEPSDTYFQRHDDANTNGFKNFSLLTVERDLDKLKFWKMCRPLQLRREALPPPSSTINDVNESGTTRVLDELTHRAQDAANNTKTNQNRNTASSRKSNIKKVWKRMKKNGEKFVAIKTNWKRAATERCLFPSSARQQVASYQPETRFKLSVDDCDSDSSISDSLSDFSTTL